MWIHDTKTISCERAGGGKRREIKTEYKWVRCHKQTVSHCLVITFVGFDSLKKKPLFPTHRRRSLPHVTISRRQSIEPPLWLVGSKCACAVNFWIKEVGWTVDSNKRQSGVCCSSPARERTEESRVAPKCRTLTPTRSRKPPATTLST